MTLRFGIQALGSEGDIRPLLALGAGLRRAGHDVAVAIHGDPATDYRKICRRHDLEYVPSSFELNFREIASRLGSQLWKDKWADGFHRMVFCETDRDEKMYEAAISLCRDNDVVITHYLSYPGKAAALKTGTPHVSVQLTHEHTLSRFRSQCRNVPYLGENLNRVMWEEAMKGADRVLNKYVEPFWASKGLPPFEHLWSLYFSDSLNLLAVSPTLCPPQPDWGDLHVVTGFLDLPDERPPKQMPDDLQCFLDAGDPPVFMAFGSATELYHGSETKTNVELLVEATRLAGCRAIIQTGSEVDRAHAANTYARGNSDIFFVGWVPYTDAISRSAAAVHHGGSGTIHLATRCCCPSIVVPFTVHHEIFGYELHHLGAAAAPIPRRNATAETLASAIQRVLGNPSFKERATELGQAMQKEDGVGNAVNVIDERL